MAVRALHRKLLREVLKMRGQALAIAGVVGAGIAVFLTMFNAFSSLRLTQETYYDRYLFGDVFASLKRAPAWLQGEIAEIPGVSAVETRVVVDVVLDVADFEEPIVGRLVSVPQRREPSVNRVFLRSGRFPDPLRSDEVVVGEAFAEAHRLVIGDALGAVINGRRRDLRVVGTGLSPEYVYAIRPGEMFPDDARFGLLWMGRKALASAFDMEGGFNDVSLRLGGQSSAAAVISRLDRLLEPYGGLGAYPRALQLSHWYLDSELSQLQRMGSVIPTIFLAVAAFLLNVVLSRVVQLQREQIAILKAVGYSNTAVSLHFIQLSLAISVFGALLGIAAGYGFGRALLVMYNNYFRFPLLSWELSPKVLMVALGIAVLAAVVGALGAVRRVVTLPPAEAMRPEAPPIYRVSLVERIGLRRFLDQPTRMVLRYVGRQPWRVGLAIVGMAFAEALLVIGGLPLDSIDHILDLEFNVAQRQDMNVAFVEPTSSSARFALANLPGVLAVEGQRSVPARLRHRHLARQVAILGLAADARLQRVVAADRQPVSMPAAGLVLSAKLAEILDVEPGDTLEVEVLEGLRPRRTTEVASVVEDYFGTAAYMDIDALHRFMEEGNSLSGAALRVDEDQESALFRRLKDTPMVAAVSLQSAALEGFNESVAATMGTMIAILMLFSGIIAFGVVYNTARISLSERGRELASLRVMGFTRAEISFILLGELAVVTLLAVPVGLAVGKALAEAMARSFDSELYRLPAIISVASYARAAAFLLLASFLSGWIVRRRLDHLDLVAVLKTRE